MTSHAASANFADASENMKPEKEEPKLKRFLLFGGATYYPGGGWCDFHGSFDSKPEAEAAWYKSKTEWLDDWYHIVDTLNPLNPDDL